MPRNIQREYERRLDAAQNAWLAGCFGIIVSAYAMALGIVLAIKWTGVGFLLGMLLGIGQYFLSIAAFALVARWTRAACGEPMTAMAAGLVVRWDELEALLSRHERAGQFHKSGFCWFWTPKDAQGLVRDGPAFLVRPIRGKLSERMAQLRDRCLAPAPPSVHDEPGMYVERPSVVGMRVERDLWLIYQDPDGFGWVDVHVFDAHPAIVSRIDAAWVRARSYGDPELVTALCDFLEHVKNWEKPLSPELMAAIYPHGRGDASDSNATHEGRTPK